MNGGWGWQRSNTEFAFQTGIGRAIGSVRLGLDAFRSVPCRPAGAYHLFVLAGYKQDAPLELGSRFNP
jgi:hypothetical protein